nr:hypothetical protein [Micromonospora nigra]
MVAVFEAYADLARRVLAGPARLGRTRMVAVDGPSGAGKTVFAARLADALGEALADRPAPDEAHGSALGETFAVGAVLADGPAADEAPGSALAGRPTSGPGIGVRPPVVHTDDLLDGWDDQLTFWTRLEEQVLAPLRAGRPGAYRRYSWVRRAFLPREVPVPVVPVLLLEGVSAARAAAVPDLTLAVFVTAPASLRRNRAVSRDGPGILPQLHRWHAGEDVHFAADRTAARADLVVDGAPTLPHDATRWYVRRR